MCSDTTTSLDQAVHGFAWMPFLYRDENLPAFDDAGGIQIWRKYLDPNSDIQKFILVSPCYTVKFWFKIILLEYSDIGINLVKALQKAGINRLVVVPVEPFAKAGCTLLFDETEVERDFSFALDFGIVRQIAECVLTAGGIFKADKIGTLPIKGMSWSHDEEEIGRKLGPDIVALSSRSNFS